MCTPTQETPTKCRTTNIRRLKRPHCLLSGGRGIRTPGAVNPAVFKTAAIDHSAIPPCISLPHDLSKMEGSHENIPLIRLISANSRLSSHPSGLFQARKRAPMPPCSDVGLLG